MDLITKLVEYFQYPFVVHALIVGTLIAVCAALLGVPLVLKRFSYIGDSLSHVAFGAMAVAAVLNFTNDLPFILVITTICAVLLLKVGQDAKIKGDAALAMVSVSMMAIGYLLMNVFSVSSNISGDVCTTLFGSTSILTLSLSDVWLCVVLCILVISIFVFFYNRLFAVTFDEPFSMAVGIKATTYNFLLAVVSAVIIVLAMKLVGSLLITALLIFPGVSAMRVCKSFKMVIVISAVFAFVCALLGMLIAILAGTPVGSTIVVINILFFAVFALIGKLKGA